MQMIQIVLKFIKKQLIIYIQKNLNIPPNTGFQLYFQALSYFYSKYEWGYGYADKWNRASSLICHRLGAEQYNFIRDYGREY